MSESWKEVLDALSDEDDRMAVLIGVVRFEKRKEKLLELLRYSMNISAKARLARELVEVGSSTEKKRRYHDAPILKLPFDVLSEIALVFSRVQENGAWPFSAVCRAWRETVLSTPRAWTNIHLRAGYSGSYHQLSYTVTHRTCNSRTPDPALCIQRAGIFPFHLELHELSSGTPNLHEFILRIMPHVQYLYIYESAGSEVRISQPVSRSVSFHSISLFIFIHSHSFPFILSFVPILRTFSSLGLLRSRSHSLGPSSYASVLIHIMCPSSRPFRMPFVRDRYVVASLFRICSPSRFTLPCLPGCPSRFSI